MISRILFRFPKYRNVVDNIIFLLIGGLCISYLLYYIICLLLFVCLFVCFFFFFYCLETKILLSIAVNSIYDFPNNLRRDDVHAYNWPIILHNVFVDAVFMNIYSRLGYKETKQKP